MIKRLTPLKNLGLFLREKFSRDWWAGVPDDTLHLKESTRSYHRSLGRNIYPYPKIKLLQAEVRYILWRIRAIRDTKIYSRMIVIDPGRSTQISLRERHRIADACILGIRNLTKSRPHLTGLEKEIYVLGWTQGHEWTCRNCCK